MGPATSNRPARPARAPPVNKVIQVSRLTENPARPAAAGVPIFHVHGDKDATVPLEANAGELARRYRQLGGSVELLVIRGKGHQMIKEFIECQPLVDFVVREAASGGGLRQNR